MDRVDLRLLAALLTPVALLVAGARRRFVRQFETSNAVDPGRAMPLPRVPLSGLWRARLTSAGVLHQSQPEHYWLDEAAWREYRGSRRRRALVLAAVMLAVLLFVLLWGRTGSLGAESPAMRVVAGAGAAGFADGTGDEAKFNKPIRLAPFGPDAVLVADIYNHALRVVSLDGRVRTLAGAPDRKGHRDGDAASAAFDSPHGVGVARDGRIAVAEAAGHTIRLLTPDAAAPGGYRVSTLAGVPGEKGNRDGPAAQALFNSPHAAVWDDQGRVYAPDIGNATIRRVADGTVSTVAGAQAGTFVYPMDLAMMPDGRLVVADAGANLLRVVDHDGKVTTLPVQATLATPHGVAVGPDGIVYEADMKSHRVLAIDRAGRVTTVAGEEGVAGSDASHLNRPAAVLVHGGWVWIADLDNHRVCAVRVVAK